MDKKRETEIKPQKRLIISSCLFQYIYDTRQFEVMINM